MIEQSKEAKTQPNSGWKGKLKAMGIAGFLFFLGKGLVWLYVFYAAGKGCAGQ